MNTLLNKREGVWGSLKGFAADLLEDTGIEGYNRLERRTLSCMSSVKK
ncbi:MAG: hypothetical protein R2827_15995 [Bdellovibrionales bacterium]